MATRLLGALALAAAFALTLVAAGWTTGLPIPLATAQVDQLEITASRSSASADGGRVEITVRLPAARGATPQSVTLTTDLGAFGADSGPARVVVTPSASADGAGLQASVVLVGDGRAGIAAVTARSGTTVAAVTVTFIGAPAEITILRPVSAGPLSAARSHVVQVDVRDSLGRLVSGAPVRLEAVGAEGATAPTLRGPSGAEGSLIALRASDNGRASASLTAPSGSLLLRAVSGDAVASSQLTFHGEVASLSTWALNPVLERGVEGGSAIVLARLHDADGRAVPRETISLSTAAGSGVTLTADGDPASLVTDAGGQVVVRVSASSAQSGDYWIQAQHQASGLSAIAHVTVVGAPSAIYITATRIPALEEAQGNVQEYVLRAEVVDPTGRGVAVGYSVRWRIVVEGGTVELDDESPPVLRGVATTLLRMEDAGPAPVLHASLIEASQVQTQGLLADLAAAGLPLRPGLNSITWVGAPKSVANAIAPIAHLDVTVWRARSDDAGWDTFTTVAEGVSDDFELMTGDRLHVRVSAAARLPGAAR